MLRMYKQNKVLHNNIKIQSCDSIFTKWRIKYTKNRFNNLAENYNIKLVYISEK
jgi:hypothetical protein